MGKTLTVAQKTFTDLYDSYILNLSSDIVAFPCDQHGAASEKYTTTITYSANVGIKSIGATCSIISSTALSGVTCDTSVAGKITITVAKNTKLANDSEIGFTFTTGDDNAFTFERYITFVKIKSGERVVTFQIKSEKGDTFKEGIDEITMKTVAFDGLTEITGATYAWSYYDSSANDWVSISADQGNKETLGSSLTVARTYKYAASVYRCIMTYNNLPYVDYFSLKIFNHSYDTVVKFFDGSNIFDPAEPFVVAYLELYKDQQEEEIIKASRYYYHTGNTYDASTGVHTFNSTDVDDSYKENGTLMYVIYKVTNAPNNSCAKYKARLCAYNGTNWYGANTTTYGNKYVYKSDLYETRYETAEATNVFVIAKEDVPRYKDVEFTVYTKAVDAAGNYIDNDNDLAISRANVTVIDLNDPFAGPKPPENPIDGQLWLDTNGDPYVLNIYQEGKWVYFSQQNGKTVYTSQPSSYSKGDLWILGPGEVCGDFQEGSMLRANQASSVYSASHWDDAWEEFTALKNNIEQNFEFSKTSGLKIGQTDNKFYVNISSEKMSFYDNSEGKHKEVVYISNESANIDGLVVETSLDVTCDATFNQHVKIGNFVLQMEENNSLSLVLAT